MPSAPQQTRRRPRPARSLLLAAPLLAALTAGCSPVGVAVGAGAAGVTASQTEKGFRNTVDDARIRAKLNGIFLSEDVDLYRAVGFTVDQGRVLLTGNVPTPEARVEAVRLTWGVDGVSEVINEIAVTDRSSLSDQSRDVWIATQVRGRLLVDDAIASINYSIDVVNKVVYVMGLARSEAELNRVLGHAREVADVRRVVNHARVARPAAGG